MLPVQVHNVRDLAGQGNPLTTLAWDQYVQNLKDHQDIHAIGMQWWALAALFQNSGVVC